MRFILATALLAFLVTGCSLLDEIDSGRTQAPAPTQIADESTAAPELLKLVVTAEVLVLRQSCSAESTPVDWLVRGTELYIIEGGIQPEDSGCSWWSKVRTASDPSIEGCLCQSYLGEPIQ